MAKPLAIVTLCAIVVLHLQDPCDCRGDDAGFNDQIRPLLVQHCIACHGPDATKREANLRLDRRDDAVDGAIVAGDADESEMYQRIVATDPDVRMPPPDSGDPLSEAEISLVRRWINEGAHYQRHWAYEPIREPAVPDHEDPSVGEIDRFVLDALSTRGLKMSPAISRQALIRRVTFDLTGLPPTWAEVQAFVKDDSPGAYANLLDRLLDSPRYGERWGRHWLDIARYADTHGGAAIGFTKFPFSYTYRDYVIGAFNADLPYDEFVTQQIAADQIGLAENDPALAAIGFLTVGMQYRNPHDTIDDQIDVISRGLLGMTVACARCHDHKYDAIPTDDYYALYATLASSQKPDRLPILGEPSDTEGYRDYEQELRRRQVSYDDMAREQSEIMRGRLRMQIGDYLRQIANGVEEQDLSAAFLSYRTDDFRPHVLNRWLEYLKQMPETDPVFGPWVKLSRFEGDRFAEQCTTLIAQCKQENGDPAKYAAMQSVRTAAPRWNPRVLDAIEQSKPTSMTELADAYGRLFASVHQQWLKVLTDTSLEADGKDKIVPDEDARHRDANSSINRQLRRHLYAPGTPTAMGDSLAVKLLNRPIKDNVTGRRGAIENLHLSSPGSPPRAMMLHEDQHAGPFHVFVRGDPMSRGQPVEARFLTALTSASPAPFPEGKRRLGLAQALVSEMNPLTRRVIVNWVWQHHFGRGLVRTPDDFGTRGQPPTHPQLLDYLALRFADDGWSLKKLHRRILMTRVYQQSALEDARSRTIDPENRLLWRMPRRRLDLEAMRDAMLFVSGELDTAMGGHPISLEASPAIPRRSVYGFVNRDIVSPLASTFDAANPNACTAQRPETNVPQQTLFALNSEFIQDRAAALADRSRNEAIRGEKDRIRFLYQQTLSRRPTSEEVAMALDYLHEGDGPSAPVRWQRLAHVLLAANEFVFLD